MRFTPNPAFVPNFLAAPPLETQQVVQKYADALEQEMENEAAIILHRLPRSTVENMIGQVETGPASIAVGVLAQGKITAYLGEKAQRPDEPWFPRAIRKIFPNWGS